MAEIILRIGKQSDIGTDASTFSKMPRGNTSMNKSGEDEKEVKLGGRGQSVLIPTSIVYEGSTEIGIGFKALKFFFEAFCGKGSTVGGTIKPNLEYQPDYYTIDLGDELEGLRFSNCVIDSLGLNVSSDNELVATVGYFSNKAKEVTINSGSDNVLYDGSDILYYELTGIKFGTIDLQAIGTSYNHTFSNNIDPAKFNTLSGREYKIIRYGDLTSEITMDTLYFNNDLRKLLWGGQTETGKGSSTINDLTITFTDKLTGDKLEIIGKAKLTSVNKTTPVNENTTQSISLRYVYDGATNSLFYGKYTAGSGGE